MPPRPDKQIHHAFIPISTICLFCTAALQLCLVLQLVDALDKVLLLQAALAGVVKLIIEDLLQHLDTLLAEVDLVEVNLLLCKWRRMIEWEGEWE